MAQTLDEKVYYGFTTEQESKVLIPGKNQTAIVANERDIEAEPSTALECPRSLQKAGDLF